MLNVLFFAQIREQLNCSAVAHDWPQQGLDLDTLQRELCETGGELWREVLYQDNIIRAVNQEVVTANCPLADGDEIAFFPPVTGG